MKYLVAIEIKRIIMNKSLLTIENLSLTYHSNRGETLAVEDISFNVNVGDFIAIVGPSGCGKTTILNMIGGLLPKSSGKILLNGEEIYNNTGKKTHNRNFTKQTTIPSKIH